MNEEHLILAGQDMEALEEKRAEQFTTAARVLEALAKERLPAPVHGHLSELARYISKEDIAGAIDRTKMIYDIIMGSNTIHISIEAYSLLRLFERY